MKTMTIINACLHLVVLAALLVMYYRLFTNQHAGMNKKTIASWWMLKALFIYVIGMHIWYALGVIGAQKLPPAWMNLVSWTGTIVALAWAQIVHKWNNLKELSKEIKHLIGKKTFHT